MAFYIEMMTPVDVPPVKQLEVECGLCAWTEADYLKELGRPDFIGLVLKDDDQIVGFLCARLIMNYDPVPAKSPASFEDSSNVHARPDVDAEILNIGVNETHRRRHAGSLLLGHFIDLFQSQNLSNIWLEVRESNHGARAFYQKHGFETVTRRKALYSNPSEDGLVMVKRL